jgi:hypothetical protein
VFIVLFLLPVSALLERRHEANPKESTRRKTIETQPIKTTLLQIAEVLTLQNSS